MTNEQREQILVLSDNFTSEQIAEKTGAGRQEIDAYLRREGITPLTKADLIRHRLYKEAAGKTREQMFQDLAVSVPTFEKYVAETGVKFWDGVKEEYKPRISFWDLIKWQGAQHGVAEYLRGIKKPR